MCAIIDANVANEVFGPAPTEAGAEFLKWLQGRKGRLITGGKNHRELKQCSKGYRKWEKEALLSGLVAIKRDRAVALQENKLKQTSSPQSNDSHILALAQLSGARLLFTNDHNLHKDFKNKQVIDQPRGKIYSTHEGSDLRVDHRRLLESKNLCRAPSRQRR